MDYEIKFSREILNSFLHILGGALVTFVMLPMSSLTISILFSGSFGAIREYLQFKRGKIQPTYIIIIDILGWVVGSLLWYFIRNYFNINADIL